MKQKNMVKVRDIKCLWCGEKTGEIIDGESIYSKQKCKCSHSSTNTTTQHIKQLKKVLKR